MISAELTEQNITDFRAKVREALAILPKLPELSEESIARLLGVDLSSGLDEIAEEALDAHPEWKPVVVNLAETAKDRKFLEDTDPLQGDTEELNKVVVLMRRLAKNDIRRTTLSTYHGLEELTAHGNAQAKVYYDRMAVYFPGRPKKKPATPTTPA